MREPIDSKSNSCTEGTKVNAVGISGKVLCLTRGDLTDGSNAGVTLAVRRQQRA